MMRTSAIATLAFGLASFASQAACSAEIKVLSLPGMMTVLEELGPKFERASGHKLAISFLVPSPMLRRIDAGDKFDVVIIGTSDIGTPEIDGLINRGKVPANSRVAIARIGVGVWIRSDAPKPDISTVAAFKQTLLTAKSVSYTKESGTGLYLAALMRRLGIAEEMQPKTKLLGGGGQNPRAVAAGDVEYGISVVSDGIGLPGVALLGLLPPEIQRWSDFVGGISSDSTEAAASRAFIQFLTSPENYTVFKARGFEPIAN
jgi:molybdate transport system substrate-binding protein